MANIALGLKVASALFLVFTVLTAFQITQQDLSKLTETNEHHNEVGDEEGEEDS